MRVLCWYGRMPHRSRLMADGSSRVPRVVIAEDDATLMYTLRLIVEEHYEIVGAVSDGCAAVETAEQVRPDVVLLDISMPRMGGIEAAGLIRSAIPDTRIIIVSNYTSSLYINEAIDRGADAYVVKGSAVLQLPEAIEAVLNGGTFRPS